MRGVARLAVAIAVLVTSVGMTASDAEARKRPHHDHDSWHDRWENRRDARRAGIIAGVVTSGIANAAGQGRVEQRYQECLYATGYDYECERMRYYEAQNARRNARRAGVVMGLTARAIVRD